ncbi:MAG: N-6 DNA methylase [Vicinamibacterales bacterium]
MIPGISGDLLSSSYVAGLVDATGGRDPAQGSRARWLVGWWRGAARTLGPASSARVILDRASRPLAEHLGFVLDRVEPRDWGHAGVLTREGRPVAALVSTRWDIAPDAAWRRAMRASVSAHVPWAVIINGRTLAIADAHRPWDRRMLVVDLATALRDERAIHAVQQLARAEVIGQIDASSLAAHVAASERAGARVCATLGDGVLQAAGTLLGAFDAITRPRQPPDRGHGPLLEQALTIVYRLLFLYYAESRHLVPHWHRAYREGYSVRRLCERVLIEPTARGTWAAVQAMCRLAHAGCRADDLVLTGFNGRLFAPARTPLGDAPVPDEAAGRVVVSLGTTPDRAGRRHIAFRDLGVEELGAVYERVLDYEPVRAGRALVLSRTATDRKTTGSFYTPRAMTDFLVRRTLAPLVEGRSSDQILALRVLDPAMGSGAFLVAACRYLTERLELALQAEGRWALDDERAARAELGRRVAEHCLYGVDLNPTAVQLARLSLWLATLAADRPLTFLDHRLAVGDSLIGARLTDLPHPPRSPGREAPDARQASLFDEAALEALARQVIPERLALAAEPRDRSTTMRRKERRFERLSDDRGPVARWRTAADLWTGLATADRPTPRALTTNCTDGSRAATPRRRPRTSSRWHAVPWPTPARYGRFTGSWRFPRSSSTRRVPCDPMRASMPSSATRRGRCFVATPETPPHATPHASAAARASPSCARRVPRPGSRAGTSTSTSCSWRACSTSPHRPDASASSCRAACRPMRAAPACAGGCSTPAASTPGPPSRTGAASSRFTAASASCSSPGRAADTPTICPCARACSTRRRWPRSPTRREPSRPRDARACHASSWRAGIPHTPRCRSSPRRSTPRLRGGPSSSRRWRHGTAGRCGSPGN